MVDTVELSVVASETEQAGIESGPVLIAEDDAMLGKILSAWLENWGLNTGIAVAQPTANGSATEEGSSELAGRFLPSEERPMLFLAYRNFQQLPRAGSS